MPKPVVFISHASPDGPLAQRLKDWIEDRLLGAVDVFVSSDGSSIRGGDRWMERIESALRSSKLVLVLCTPNSAERRWLFFEAGGAYFLGAKVLPLCSNGIALEALAPPLSFLQGFDLHKPDHVRRLLTEISDHAGLRSPTMDELADSAWLAVGTARPVAQPAMGSWIAPSAYQFEPLNLKVVGKLVEAMSVQVKEAAERALLALESSWQDQALVKLLVTSPAWVSHVVNKLQAGSLALPAATTTTGTAQRPTPSAVAAHVKSLAQREGWSSTNALLDLNSTLPESAPILLREVLILNTLDDHDTFGWQIQLELAKLLSVYPDPITVNAFGTVLRHGDVQPGNSFVDGLLARCRQMIPDTEQFEAWFRKMSGKSFEAYAAEKDRYHDKMEKRLEMLRRGGRFTD